MAEPSTPLDVTVVTGMSGAGRSAAADVLEDLGFFVIDNLPPALIPKVAELGRGREGASRFALVVDTRAGEYLPDLESALAELRESGARTRVLFLDAFGYKHGLPLDVDLVFDCRFLPNPHWIESLRPLPGTDPKVRRYVMKQEETQAFLEELSNLFELLLPAYVREGKSYLSIGVGCTGGRHRSVVIAAEIARVLERLGFPARVHHRDLERE